CLADAQYPLLGPLRARQRIVLRAAHRSAQHRVGCPCQAQRALRQRIAVSVDTRAAKRRALKLDPEPVSRERVEHLDRLRDDLRTYAVTGEYSNFHIGYLPQRRKHLRLPP